MPKQMDAWIIEWYKRPCDDSEAKPYGYTIHVASARQYLGDLYEKISAIGEIGPDVAFPGLGWGSVLQAKHVRVDCDSELGKLLTAKKAVRTHVDSTILHDFHDEVDRLAHSSACTVHYVFDYIPLEEAQRHRRLRKMRAKCFQP